MKYVVALLILAAAGFALAQSQVVQTGQTSVILPPQNPTPVNVTTSMGPVNSLAMQQHDIRVNTMANDTFVVVKDVTDSQIVFVYRVDQLGKVSLADKKRFYY